ncbi:hypothetical protein QO002_004499 [Pararhizobium capsulatum DSM 1112]|uniref:Uncharacterized protein n=1 Tax=Pararhizobium capsulatum DSM 1112 TaxID=1121113 RepID=A0ABU0BVK9_9HYPH|nr:hypothetical protein [Pararhizobium capsulatum DSM 1112]
MVGDRADAVLEGMDEGMLEARHEGKYNTAKTCRQTVTRPSPQTAQHKFSGISSCPVSEAPAHYGISSAEGAATYVWDVFPLRKPRKRHGGGSETSPRLYK